MIEKLFIVLRSLVCNYHVIRSRIINIRANCLLGGLLQQFGMMVHIRVTGVKRKKHIEQASQFCCSDLGWNCFSGYQFGEGRTEPLKTAVVTPSFPSLEMGLLLEPTPLRTWFSRMSLSCDSSTSHTNAFSVKA